MVLQVRGRLEGDIVSSEMDFDELGSAVAASGIAVVHGVFDRAFVENVRDQIMAWGR